jgi:ectoine hydroxylase-related dioxygenase (phytanoyl-CoA dioxygenase family)
MGFFKSAKNAVQQYQNSINQPNNAQEVKVIFGENYISKCNEILRLVKTGKWKGGNQISISFDDDLLDEIDGAVQSHQATARVMYSEDMQFLDVVGESFHQDELRALYNQVQDSWLSGFLMPEPLNPHDSNAVSVMIITESTDKSDAGKFEVIQAGHLKKEQAKKVSKKLISLCENDAYIPILCKLSGGSLDKPSLGLIARAKTDKIKF